MSTEPTIEEQIRWMKSVDDDDETTHPICKAILSSLRRVALLEAVAEAARGVASTCDDNGALHEALAALDAAKEAP